MKTKDIVSLAILGIILIIIGVLLSNHFGKGSKARTAEVEIVQPIEATFDEEGKQMLLNKDAAQAVQSFSVPVDLSQGLGNTTPFNAAQ